MVLVLAAVAGGCRREAPPTAPGFSVWLITSAPLSGRWEREAERGLGRLQVELGAEVGRQRAWSPEDRRGLLRAAAAAAPDLVFCVGPGFDDLLYSEGAALGDTRFVVVPGRSPGDSVASIRFQPEGTGFLAGAVTAELAAGAPVGILRGAGRPWLEALERGFVDGARSEDPERSILVADGPSGPWELTAAGVVVALYSADVPDAETLAAVHDSGLLLVAPDLQLMAAVPEAFVAAVDVDVAEAMVRVARTVRDGTFGGRALDFDLGSGVLDVHLSPNHPIVSDRARQRLREARAEVLAGYVEVEKLGM